LRPAILTIALLAAACSSSKDDPLAAGGGAGGMAGGAPGAGGAGGAGGTAAGGSGGGGAPPVEAAIEIITDRHRYDPPEMFGGWGPHLGHLVRAPASDGSGDTLWFVDDYCAQAGSPGAQCDVLDDHTIGYFERTAAGWVERHTRALPGNVQQNTGTIVEQNGDLHTFGIDVTGARAIAACRYAPATGPLPCTTLGAQALTAASNYIGAAVSPLGYRMLWWTNVSDGGGGDFAYLVDFGSGWNEHSAPVTGGYNDASYINVTFDAADPNLFTMHAELVSGFAPSWTFTAGVGRGNFSQALTGVTFSTPLAGAGADKAITTNDVLTDPVTGDTHLVARTQGGDAAYYHAPAALPQQWAGPHFVVPQAYRARFLWSNDQLVLVYGPNDGGLAYRVATAADRPAGEAIDWAALPETTVTLPEGFGWVVAIYPESPMYQNTAASGLHVVVVGDAAQNVAAHVSLLGD
jgi:hypothetical protein